MLDRFLMVTAAIAVVIWLWRLWRGPRWRFQIRVSRGGEIEICGIFALDPAAGDEQRL